MFRNERLPKYLTHLETNLNKSKNGFLVSSGYTYADLVLFQIIEGVRLLRITSQ
jgi:hypothetical protein